MYVCWPSMGESYGSLHRARHSAQGQVRAHAQQHGQGEDRLLQGISMTCLESDHGRLSMGQRAQGNVCAFARRRCAPLFCLLDSSMKVPEHQRCLTLHCHSHDSFSSHSVVIITGDVTGIFTTCPRPPLLLLLLVLLVVFFTEPWERGGRIAGATATNCRL